ncbi:hypothetical protein COU00_00525 [Candidatus Falkowbacteria bacterium CG10_big_fil_rev_8_21_14_0_10_43_11]|uniref:Uncharacterized protein n=1 Tax=Candidatus Falkowbacteria bacterium CG10_big_fil_rev_8_21_14_0_10_43_11 TaxID=1974568 RepID=A0A2M6WMX7_9BACT|nr:MAG: hypothetical protein COU00_00525 [Candidatus Falkowbacteria bacterium CG10_big_fil_rev_8_21_14_0_10_43_11]
MIKVRIDFDVDICQFEPVARVRQNFPIDKTGKCWQSPLLLSVNSSINKRQSSTGYAKYPEGALYASLSNLLGALSGELKGKKLCLSLPKEMAQLPKCYLQFLSQKFNIMKLVFRY